MQSRSDSLLAIEYFGPECEPISSESTNFHLGRQTFYWKIQYLITVFTLLHYIKLKLSGN